MIYLFSDAVHLVAHLRLLVLRLVHPELRILHPVLHHAHFRFKLRRNVTPELIDLVRDSISHRSNRLPQHCALALHTVDLLCQGLGALRMLWRTWRLTITAVPILATVLSPGLQFLTCLEGSHGVMELENLLTQR